METKKFSKLALHQETVRKLTQNDRAKNELATHRCPPTVGCAVTSWKRMLERSASGEASR